MRRRTLLASSFALTPVFSALLAACNEDDPWPEGMTPIKWDRDTCQRCKMIISDRRFAVEIKGGPKDTVFKFDDIGCAATWRVEKIEDYPWMTASDTRFWVAAYPGGGKIWLDPQTAHFQSGHTSPMGYNYAAFASAQADSISYVDVQKLTSSFWPASCLPTSR